MITRIYYASGDVWYFFMLITREFFCFLKCFEKWSCLVYVLTPSTHRFKIYLIKKQYFKQFHRETTLTSTITYFE